MKNRTISIIVPCYNQAQYLDECLESVSKQTFQNWECIIVDDGSPDNTEEIALQWAKKDHRFQYFKKENGGVSLARNFGIDKSSGEWILPLDGDDRIGNQYLELASREFKNNHDIIYCKASFFGNINVNFNLKKFSYNDFLLQNLIFCSAFYKKEAWLKTKGYDPKLIYGYEDWEFWINLLKNSDKKIICLDYLGFYYRRKDSSRDVNINKNKKQKEDAFNYIFNKHQDEYFKEYGTFFDIIQENKKLEIEKSRLMAINNESILKKIFRKFRK